MGNGDGCAVNLALFFRKFEATMKVREKEMLQLLCASKISTVLMLHFVCTGLNFSLWYRFSRNFGFLIKYNY